MPSLVEWLLVLLALYVLCALWLRFKPVPSNLHGARPRPFRVPADKVQFWSDETRVEAGTMQRNSRIVDRVLSLVRDADDALLDIFLLDLHSTGDKLSRPDTRRLAQAVRESDVNLWVLADPVNTQYRTCENPPFQWLEDSGAQVVQVDLDILRHNNLLYGPLYAILAPCLSRRRFVPDVVRGNGKVAPYALATALGVRGDHRKVLITRKQGVCRVLVASANLSDSSAYYDNVAIEVEDEGVAGFLLEAERALARASGADLDWSCQRPAAEGAAIADEQLTDHEVSITPMMGAHIGRAISQDIANAKPGDRVVVGVLFLSSRACIRELVRAQLRGVSVHVVVDKNKESFGTNAGGFPNRVVVHDLLRRAPQMDVRFHKTDQEFHTKFIYIQSAGRRVVHAGSANLTRRSLIGTNLETNLRLELLESCELAAVFDGYVERLLSDACSRPAEAGQDVPRWWHAGYLVCERIGLINC